MERTKKLMDIFGVTKTMKDVEEIENCKTITTIAKIC